MHHDTPRTTEPRPGAALVLRMVGMLSVLGMVGLVASEQPAQLQSHRPSSAEADRLIKSLEIPAKRLAAVTQLLRLGAEAAPDLGRAMSDPREDIVFCLAHILHLLGPAARSAVPHLERAASRDDPKLADAARWALSAIQPTGATLIADYVNARVVELGPDGKTRRVISKQSKAWNAQLLPNGHILVTCIHKVVKEYDRNGKVVWKFTHGSLLRDAQRLPSGHTLLLDEKGYILEVDAKGKVLWKRKQKGTLLYDVDRLPSGRTLVADYGRNIVYEMDDDGKVTREVWKGSGGALKVQRLPNGNTLIALYSAKKVIEVDATGKTVFEIAKLNTPNDAVRLHDGTTIVGETGHVRTFDRKGKEIGKIPAGRATSVRRY